MFKALGDILRMIRFSHTVFALPFALIAAFLAGRGGEPGYPGHGPLVLIVACMVFARSAAMTFNRLVDRRIDARNPRTAGRELPTGRIRPGAAWTFFVVCCAGFVGTTVLFWQPVGGWFGYGNPWPTVLSGPFLVFLCVYSYTKRFTALSHFWLGASLMLAPVGAWIALAPPEGSLVSVEAVLLAAAVLLWVGGFDIVYACQDIEVDRREGLYSLPAKLGAPLALWVSRLCHSLMVTALLGLGLLVPELGGLYLAGVLVAAGLLVVEHILVAAGQVRWAFNLNTLVGMLLAATTIADLVA